MDTAPNSGRRPTGPYETLAEIARGGMATVYLARVTGAGGFERLVALKALHEHLASDPAMVKTLLDEARLAARIHHPNVVSTLEVLDTPGAPTLVMEAIDGPTLKNLMSAGPPMPRPVALRIFCDALSGLHAAHELTAPAGQPLDLVHRDFTPHNILVGCDGSARITDFGVARASQRLQVTKDGSIKGKLSYMAPEQLRGEPLDRRADIYAAGVVLWELLTNRRLHGRPDNEVAAIYSVLTTEVPNPSDIDPSIDSALAEVALAALAKEPDQRPPTAMALQQALLTTEEPLASVEDVAEWVALASVHRPLDDLRTLGRLQRDPLKPDGTTPHRRELMTEAPVGTTARKWPPAGPTRETLSGPSHRAQSGADIVEVLRITPASPSFLEPRLKLLAQGVEHCVELHSVVMEDDTANVLVVATHGVTLQQLLDERGPLPDADVASLLLRVALGLAPFHAQGMAHGGLTRDAVVLDHAAGDRVSVILRDFVLTPSLRPSADRAPEGGLAPSVDQWAIGSLIEAMGPPAIGTPLANIAKRCMRQSPADRFDHLSSLAVALAEVAHYEDAELADRVLELSTRPLPTPSTPAARASAPSPTNTPPISRPASRTPAIRVVLGMFAVAIVTIVLTLQWSVPTRPQRLTPISLDVAAPPATTLVLEVSPATAQVMLDGRNIDWRRPPSLPADARARELVVSAAGHRTQRQTLHPRGDSLHVTIQLEKEVPVPARTDSPGQVPVPAPQPAKPPPYRPPGLILEGPL